MEISVPSVVNKHMALQQQSYLKKDLTASTVVQLQA